MQDIIIDYIIPTYYDSSIVKNSLDKLCRQTMKDNLKVIIVNDCSPNTDCNYQDIIDEYRDTLDITVVKTPYNSGPGMAMQYGIDAGTSKYYLIQDDDDCIASDDVIESYIKVIKKHINENNIVSIMGDAALCDKDYNTIHITRDSIVHGRLFYRDFMEYHNIRYTDNVSWWVDDYYLNSLILLEGRHNYKDIKLDKICYLYRVGLDGSVTNKIGKYEQLFRSIALDVEIRKFLDIKYGIDNDIRVYKNINKKLFDTMLMLILIQYNTNVIREREWNILSEYRKYLLNIIKNTNKCDYIEDGRLFDNYRDYVLGYNNDEKILEDINIDEETLSNMYYTYLDDSKTMFNCNYNEIDSMIKES